MILLHRLGLLFMMLMVFVIPLDGISFLAELPVLKAAGLMAFGFVALLLMGGVAIRGKAWFIALSLIYVSWTLLSFLWTWMPVDYQHPEAINSQQSIRAYLYLLGMIILLFQLVRTEADLQWLLVSFLAGSFCLAGLFLLTYSPDATTVRHGLKQRDANEMAVQLAMALPVAFYLLQLSRYWWAKALAVVYVPAAVLCIIATGSRTGFIVLFIGLLGLIPLVLRSGILARLLGIMALVAAIVVVFNTIPAKTFERVLSTRAALTDGTLNERSIVWQKAWQEMREHPFIGQGLGSFRRVVNKYNVDYTAHNGFVSISVEQGVVGLLLYMAVVLLSLYYAWQLDNRRRLFIFSMVLVIVMGQMSLTLHENMYTWFAYVLAAVTLYTHYTRTSVDRIAV